MQYFFLRLLPPRSTFPQDITEAEKQVMQEHITYWKKWTEQGTMIVFGPVLDPEGTYGVGIVEVESEDDILNLITNDPVTKANLGKYEFFPMKVGAVRSHTATR